MATALPASNEEPRKRRRPVRSRSAKPVRPTKTETSTRREWERGTQLVGLFVATGSFWEHRATAADEGKTPRVKPANILLVSEPGRGKTELLDRFRLNTCIEYRSDLTVRGLWRLLSHSSAGICSHIGATEFQKFFQRKQATADNLMGLLVQAMEEGVDKLDIGSRQIRMSPPARIGLIGAITHGTLDKKQEYLKEMGFLSRTAVIPWELPMGEMVDIMTRISDGEIDLRPVKLNLPEKHIGVELPAKVSRLLEPYVKEHWKAEMLRVFVRFRQLVMAAAVLEGRDVAEPKDVDLLREFHEYWKRMVTE